MAKKQKPQEKNAPVPSISSSDSGKQFSSLFKSFILMIVAGVCTIAFFSLPIYNNWLKGQIKGYYTEYKKQKKISDIHTRWEQRHGYDFIIPEYLGKQIDNSKQVFLLPPPEYVKKNNVGYNWTDPRWLYYMTEKKIRKVNVSDSNYRTATYTILATPQGLNIVLLSNDSIWKQTLAAFK